MHQPARRLTWPAFAAPVAACAAGIVLVILAPQRPNVPGATGVAGASSFVLLVLAVLATMRHAEAMSEHFGRVAGTITFTLAANAVEVSIIAFMMLHKENNPTLARDTVSGIVMFTCAGVVGACLLVGALAQKQQAVDSQATSAYLGVLAALVTIFLVLPTFLPPRSEHAERVREVICAVLSLALYALFLSIQFVSGRADRPGRRVRAPARPGIWRSALLSGVFSLLGLAGIVLLAKEVSADLEDVLLDFGFTGTDAVVGAVIAVLVLLPESLDALHAARRKSVQHSLDIALGAALASIGLLIPSVVLVGAFTGREVTLGLGQAGIAIMALTLLLSVISFGAGRTNVLTGAVHLVVFATFVLMLFG